MVHSILQNTYLLLLLILLLGHQFIEKILGLKFPFIDNYLDDLICIPILLFLFESQLKWMLKKENYKLALQDSILVSLVFSLFFEELLPLLNSNFTKDLWDYLAYGLGWALFYFFSFYKSAENKP